MIQRLLIFLGIGRARALFALFAATGLISLMLNSAAADETTRLAQTLLSLTALIGAVVIVGSAFEREARARYAAIVAPALGALMLGLTVLPQYGLALLGGAVGWVVAGLFLFRVRAPSAYQKAVRALRRNRLDEAVEWMDELIKAEPNEPAHYRFRAELLRVWGKLDRARRDYRRMIELDPESAVAFNGLAEVELQARRYAEAHAAAEKAAALAPDEWVAFYNLGMIEDRLGRSEDAIRHLTQASAMKIPDARHRLLIQVYLAKAYARIGAMDDARRSIEALKKQANGLREWQTILGSDQAQTLREAIGEDVALAERLIAREIDANALADMMNGSAVKPR
jgi:tetratricopeptide (TPR) repeat protein